MGLPLCGILLLLRFLWDNFQNLLHEKPGDFISY